MEVKVKKIVTGFTGAGFIVAGVFFGLNDSHNASLREKPKSKHSVYQSKVLPVEKIEKAKKAQSAVVAKIQKKELVPAIKDGQEAKVKQADARAIQNILNIRLKSETSLASSKTAEKTKFKVIPDARITAVRLKSSTAIHLAQAL